MSQPQNTRHHQPAPKRKPPLREQLQTKVNDVTTSMVSDAFAEIDDAKASLVKKLDQHGFTGMDQVVETGAEFFKALLVRGISK